MEVVLELSNVVFPSRSGPFSVSVSCEGQSMRIWLESKQTKAQWECLVKDVKDHTPTGANYMLPPEVVLKSLRRGLTVLDKEEKKYTSRMNGCIVELQETKTGPLELVLTLQAFDSLEARYMFTMTPMAVGKVDILDAKIRDLEEAVAKAKPVILSTSSTNVRAQDRCVVWNNPAMFNEDYFELSQDKTEVTILESGLYDIQMSGRVVHWIDMIETVHCLVDDVCVASAFVGQSKVFGINRMMLLKEDSNIKFRSCGMFNLAKGCILNIVLVQRVPSE
ncbi:hypothetical protein AC1031_007894 [Aphanomyces cochlioides]|nr:hypothetical protein AC1031_007894 [Aphanomyces cochlioides]